LTDADLSKAEKMIEDIESYVESAAWHSGRNLRAVSEMMAIDVILNDIEQGGPSSPVLYYLERLGIALNLRKRWLRLRDELPPNPFGSPLVSWRWKLLSSAPGESENSVESQAERITMRAEAHPSNLAEERLEETETITRSETEEVPNPLYSVMPSTGYTSHR
jgi:hypothetical protein